MADTSGILKAELLPQTRQLGSIVSSCNTVMQSLPKIAMLNNTHIKEQKSRENLHSEEEKKQNNKNPL